MGQPPKNGAKQVLVSESRSVSWFGPLPPPAVLESYEKAMPGAMERIVAMAEAEAGHRRMLDVRILDEQHESRKEVNAIAREGQRFAFFIAIFSFACASLCAYMKQSVVAALFVGTTLVGLVQAFMQARHGTRADDPGQTRKAEP